MDYFDLLIALSLLYFGVNALMACAKLNKTGVLFENKMLYPTDCDYTKCKDPAAFIKFMSPRMVVFGVIALLEAGIGILNMYYPSVQYIYFAVMGLFLCVLIWFGISTRQASQKFW
ncbi:MAG: hypothetical protein RR058_03410 [Oscillospiraceae bacterium]